MSSRHRPELALTLDDACLIERDFAFADPADEDLVDVRRAHEQRLSEGRFFIDEAAAEIARLRGGEETLRDDLAASMVRAGANGDLIVRDRLNYLPITQGERVSLARVVLRGDVNAWLAAAGAGYRWTEVTAENNVARQKRRAERFEALGGKFIHGASGKQRGGRRGALAELAREERGAGRPYNDVRDVARDLDAAADLRRSRAALPRS